MLYKTSSWAEHIGEGDNGVWLGGTNPRWNSKWGVAWGTNPRWSSKWGVAWGTNPQHSSCCSVSMEMALLLYNTLVAITMVTGFLCSILQYREDPAGSSLEDLGACRGSRRSLEGIRSSLFSWQGQRWWLYQVRIFAHNYMCTIICWSSFLIFHCTKILSTCVEVGGVTKFTNLQRLVVCGGTPKHVPPRFWATNEYSHYYQQLS